MHSQGDVSSEEVQDDVQPVVEQTAANSLEDEMHQGAHSLEDVQDDGQKVVECQTHCLEVSRCLEGAGVSSPQPGLHKLKLCLRTEI